MYSTSYIIEIIFGFIASIIFTYLVLIVSIGIFILYKRKKESRLKDFFSNGFARIRNIWIKIKSPFIHLFLRFLTFYSYIPIILGILFPMFALMVPLYYLSWTILGSHQSLLDWKLYYYIIPQEMVYVWILAEIIIFCIGSGIFIAGFITMVIEKKKGTKIIQNGIYRYIRHPQNLGIIITSLPFAFFIPFLDDLGVRMGDILSWGIFSFFITLLSFFEEWSLMKKNTEKFMEYYDRTGFYLPNINPNKNINKNPVNFYKKGVIMIFVFGLLIFLFRLIIFGISENLMIFKLFR